MSELAPGAVGLARIQPLAPELWGRVRLGSVLTMREGSRVVGYARVLDISERPAYWTPVVAVFVKEAPQFCAFVDKSHTYALAARLSIAL